jgi:murein DD-endopeptidase MepM/ murein hydrolase activator NlpD
MKQNQNPRGSFLEGKGFYILLLLCVAAIAISGYYLFRGLFGQESGFGSEEPVAVSGQASLTEDTPTDDQTAQESALSSQDTQEEESDGTDEADADQDTVAPPNEVAAANLAYVWPVDGEVDRDFSLEVFAYDETMGDWRTHSGIDIAAEVGTPVAACTQGTVTQVSTDQMMGTTVTIDHGSGMESVYANLAAALNVQEGTQVEAGSVIGTVGTSAIAESASPAHLHFELAEYGVSIDPLQYLH